MVSTYRYPVSLPRTLAKGKTAMKSLPDYPALAVLAGDNISVRIIYNEEHGDCVKEGARGYLATVPAILKLLGKASE